MQEPDGSLTLIGRDGAIVPLDPHASRAPAQIVADLERRCRPSWSSRRATTRRRRRRLATGAAASCGRAARRPELQLLRERLDHDEQA